MELFDKVLEEVRKVLPEGYQVAVVGGSVRDTLLGLPFKDIDIAVISPDNTYNLVGSPLLDCDYEEFGFKSDEKESENTYGDGSFDRMLVGCIKIKVLGYPVDLLFQKEARTFTEVVSMFDHIANMVYWKDGAYHSRVSLDRVLYLAGRSQGVNDHFDVSHERAERMLKLYNTHYKAILQYLLNLGEKDVKEDQAVL